MTIYKEFVLAINSYIEAHKLILRHKLWVFVLIPGIINLLLFALIFAIAWTTADAFAYVILDFIGIGDEEGIMYMVKIVISFLIRVILILMYLMVYKYVVLIIMSPFMAILSEKIEKIVTETQYSFHFSQFIKDVIRGSFLAIKNMFIELVLIAVLMILSFVPLLNFITPVMILLVQGYFFGFSLIDYTNERKKLSVKESAKFVSEHKGLSIGIGLGFYGLLLIPVLGLLLAPTYGVTAATLSVLKQAEQD
ncbi:MAG: hypothetical protein COC01_05465 [Bacteroidetes bacterium]|nr:MAG: hypothetical protein COC01_05465 [Bacteroidota bacterium]